jgi:hypothetical protein
LRWRALLHCLASITLGCVRLLHLDPVLRRDGTIARAARFRDQTLQAHAASGAEQLRPDLARTARRTCRPDGRAAAGPGWSSACSAGRQHGHLVRRGIVAGLAGARRRRGSRRPLACLKAFRDDSRNLMSAVTSSACHVRSPSMRRGLFLDLLPVQMVKHIAEVAHVQQPPRSPQRG